MNKPDFQPKESRFSASITLKAPFVTQASGAMKHGLDTSTRQHNGRPVIPGSLIRGNLREILEEFSQAMLTSPEHVHEGRKLKDNIVQWFGDESRSSNNKDHTQYGLTPQRAILVFDYFFYAEKSPAANTPRHRIQIDTTTGTVKTGSIAFIESLYATGENITFSGNIWFSPDNLSGADEVNDSNCHKECQRWLQKALDYLSALGSYKSIGFGKVLSGNVQQDNTDTSEQPTFTPQNNQRVSFYLSPDRPFCIARPQAGGNRFETEDYIPGNVIKGIIARRYSVGGQNPVIGRAVYDRIQFSHAYPIKDKSSHRPRYLPKSIATFPLTSENSQAADSSLKDQAVDLICEQGPCLINDCAPAFATDWKDSDAKAAENLFDSNWGHRNKILSVHTRTNAQTGAAEDEALFSMETIDPENEQWLFTIDYSRAPDETKSDIEKLLNDITRHGLDKLGKTKARAQITQVEPGAPGSIQKLPDLSNLKQGDFVYLTLESHAHILPDDHSVVGTNGSEPLNQLYSNYFKFLRDKDEPATATDSTPLSGLSLSHYYASQTLRGGRFLNTKHQQKSGNIFWLTEPGSVFALKIDDSIRAKETLAQWALFGLQPWHPNSWLTNPYQPENGYGEITLRLAPIEDEKAPPFTVTWREKDVVSQ